MATIVLIPGAGGDSHYWHLVVPLLEKAGHEVIAPDLPAGDETAGIEQYADVVIAAVGERTDLVLVAQSMGGYTAAAVAERVPVSQLIFVNAMIPDHDTAGQWWTILGESDAESDSEFDLIATFFHDVDPAVTAEVMERGETPQADAPFDTPNTWTAWRGIPTRAIASTRDRMFPIDFMRKQVRDRLGILPDEIDAGHLVAFSRPVELAELILDMVR